LIEAELTRFYLMNGPGKGKNLAGLQLYCNSISCAPLVIVGLPSVEITVAGAKFYFYYEASVRRSWTAARQVCQSRGLDLAMVKSAALQAELHPQLQALYVDRWYSIGGYQQVKDGPWVWVDGTPLTSTYTNWQAGRPDDAGGGQDCLIVWVIGRLQGLWDDTYCSDVSPFLCGDAGAAGESIKHALDYDVSIAEPSLVAR
jgi:hypothetical protein